DIEEITTNIEEFTLNMQENRMNLSYGPELEPRSITISFWAKLSENSASDRELLFALHDGRPDYLTNNANTTTKYGIQKTVSTDRTTGEEYATIALYMRLPLVEGGEYHTSYFIQNKENILETDKWHHFAFTYSPDMDSISSNRGIARVFHDGQSNMSFIHRTTVGDEEYYVTSDMNDTAHKSYNAPTFSFGKFSGSIDDLRIYNRVLSSDEVLELSKVRK
ncbi:MAG: LamG-like jellyroll fold domain-containing protein, partial [Campylobacterota bacterium]|nr:LamG-like jellyroll fold domain-containing protein [Campylobacterota bacterium]